jgi:hypothetical protein
MPSAYETDRQRAEIRKVYDNEEWRKRLNLMDSDQVYAIYRRLKNQKNSKLL